MTSSHGDQSAVPPLARRLNEAYLYLDIQECTTCGSRLLEPERTATLGEVDGQPVTWIPTVCAHCGATDEYVFRRPPKPLTADEFGRFGGAEPSELLDPGQWLLLADGLTEDIPDAPEELTGEGREDLRDRVEFAADAVVEAMKFLRKDDDAVSAFAFWTTQGYGMYADSRWRFERDRLAAQLDGYRQTLVALVD